MRSERARVSDWSCVPYPTTCTPELAVLVLTQTGALSAQAGTARTAHDPAGCVRKVPVGEIVFAPVDALVHQQSQLASDRAAQANQAQTASMAMVSGTGLIAALKRGPPCQCTSSGKSRCVAPSPRRPEG